MLGSRALKGNHSIVFCVFMQLLASALFGQKNDVGKKVIYRHSDQLIFDKSYLNARRMIGSVVLEYEGTVFYCDSAHLFENENFEAFSRIRMVKGSSYTMQGDRLLFDKSKRTAQVFGNVTLNDQDITLSSSYLHYDLNTEIASYNQGGKIVSRKNNNTLTSEIGTYHSPSKVFNFRKSVKLKNKDYTVTCDTLVYHDATETAYFQGPTHIVGKENKLYCENGWYNSRTEICQFNDHASITSDHTILKGDSIYYDGKKGVGEVFRNVTVNDTLNHVMIVGGYGRHLEKKKESLVTCNAILTQITEKQDSLHIHADTLYAIEEMKGRQTILAWHRVLIYRKDLQGKCDSLDYHQVDSVLHMHYAPVLWSEENQITGDSISIGMKNGKIDQLLVRGNSFIASQANGNKYNQIKGRNITGSFQNNELTQVFVEGNGELIYVPSDDKKKKPIGVNKGECSNIFIAIKDRKIKSIRMETESDSQFNPLRLSKVENETLDGFLWRVSERPVSKGDLLIKGGSGCAEE